MECDGCGTKRIVAAAVVIVFKRKRLPRRIWMEQWLKLYNFSSNWERLYDEWQLSNPVRFQTLTR